MPRKTASSPNAVQLNVLIDPDDQKLLKALQKRLEERAEKKAGVPVQISLAVTIGEALAALNARLDDLERPR